MEILRGDLMRPPSAAYPDSVLSFSDPSLQAHLFTVTSSGQRNKCHCKGHTLSCVTVIKHFREFPNGTSQVKQCHCKRIGLHSFSLVLKLLLFSVSGVTILLSLTVFHNIVTETLPQVSDAMPLLGTCLLPSTSIPPTFTLPSIYVVTVTDLPPVNRD